MVRTIDRRVIDFKKIVFKFEELHPCSAYIMCLEIDDDKGKPVPSFCHFRTLMRPSSSISSVALLSLTTRDHCFPSYRLSKVSIYKSTDMHTIIHTYIHTYTHKYVLYVLTKISTIYYNMIGNLT